MANEISLSINFAVSKGGASVSGQSNASLTMSGEQFISNVQIIGITNETLVFGDVSTIGYVYCKNLDATNFVTISVDSAQAQVIAKLLPGEACIFKPGTTTVNAKADTAPVNLQVVACEL